MTELTGALRADARHSGKAPQFGPDAKAQVSLRYENGKPVAATSVVVSTQHADGLDQAEVREIVRPYVLAVLPVSVGVILYLLNPEYMLTLFRDPVGRLALAVAAVLQTTGYLWIRKIVNIDI